MSHISSEWYNFSSPDGVIIHKLSVGSELYTSFHQVQQATISVWRKRVWFFRRLWNGVFVFVRISQITMFRILTSGIIKMYVRLAIHLRVLEFRFLVFHLLLILSFFLVHVWLTDYCYKSLIQWCSRIMKRFDLKSLWESWDLGIRY